MRTSFSLRWVVAAVSVVTLLALASACTREVQVPGETVVVEKVVTETVEVPGETVVVEKEVIKTVEVPGQTVTKEVVREVMVPGETVVVKEEVIKTVEVPGQTVVKEVVKEVQVPGETVVVEKEVVKTVEVPGQTVVVEKEVVKEVQGERFVSDKWGELAERPQYGGSMTVAIYDTPAWSGFDTYYAGGGFWSALVLETLGDFNWGYNRAAFGIISRYKDHNHIGGILAESWDISGDQRTFTFNIHKGVNWHDKAPVNGRELTAHDVAFTYNRIVGLHPDYEKSATNWNLPTVPFTSIAATDDYTVVMEVETAALDVFDRIFWNSDNAIMAREAIEQTDSIQWENVIGSGPYELTGYVDAGGYTFEKNPNYWRNDPLHPALENRLPYIDQIREVVIPDIATRAAAMRTGKTAIAGGKHLPLDQIKGIQRTNPELIARKLTGTSGSTPSFRADIGPFSDVNVRTAMQKAINLRELNLVYYGGDADETPWGYVTSFAQGMFTPYADWPDEVKWQYEYHPDEAERLLDEAGYPRGANGIRFTATWDISESYGHDPDLDQIIATYWDKIGVDVTINNIADDNVMWDRTDTFALRENGDMSNGLTAGCCRHFNVPPHGSITFRYKSGVEGPGRPGRYTGASFNTLDSILDEIAETTDREKFNKLTRDMDMEYIRLMISPYLPVYPLYMLHQPWLKGYRGELGGGFEEYAFVLPYVWIDQELKQDMGQ